MYATYDLIFVSQQEKLKKQLKLKVEMAKFLQETIHESALQKKTKKSSAAEEFSAFVEKVCWFLLLFCCCFFCLFVCFRFGLIGGRGEGVKKWDLNEHRNVCLSGQLAG